MKLTASTFSLNPGVRRKRPAPAGPPLTLDFNYMGTDYSYLGDEITTNGDFSEATIDSRIDPHVGGNTTTIVSNQLRGHSTGAGLGWDYDLTEYATGDKFHIMFDLITGTVPGGLPSVTVNFKYNYPGNDISDTSGVIANNSGPHEFVMEADGEDPYFEFNGNTSAIGGLEFTIDNLFIRRCTEYV